MLTFKDYKIKGKKILEILNLPFLPRITVGTYKYGGYTIYEDLCRCTDFYCQVGYDFVQGSFKYMTDCIDSRIEHERTLSAKP